MTEVTRLSLERKKQVLARTSLTNTQLYLLIKAKLFPPPVAISDKSVAWVTAEVDDWIERRIAASRAADKQTDHFKLLGKKSALSRMTAAASRATPQEDTAHG